MTEGIAERPRPGSVLGNRDFALLWTGRTVSLAGNGIFTVALPLEVFRLTGSSLDLALIVAARSVPAVLLLVSGTVVDRMSRRLVLLASDSACAVAAGAVAVLIGMGIAHLWELAALTAFFGVANAFFRPAATAITPEILPAQQLMSASSLNSLSESLAQYLLGPLAGGVIVAVTGSAWAFGLDAISFAVSAACLLAMHRTKRPARQASHFFEGAREGLRYCRSQPWLWWSMVAVGIANFVCFLPFTIFEALLVDDAFHAGAVALGLMYSASGAGGALAAIAASRLPAPRRRVTAIWAAWAGGGLAAFGLGVAPTLWLAMVLAGLTWAGVTYGNIVWYPLMQQEVPPELLGRASSIDWLFSLALAPFGTVAGGALVALIGIRLTLICSGLLTCATGAVLLIPGVTDPDRRPAPVPLPVRPGEAPR
jgi:MFS family permease